MKKLLLVFLIVFNFSDLYSQCLSGNYTIGGATPDYSNFSSAITALTTNGICGSVVFNVRSGTYTEQLIIPSIVGTNASNTITFKSESSDSTSVILTYATSTSVSTPNFTLKINGCDHTKFSKMTLSRTGNGDYARVIDIGNNSDSVVFQNCIIKNTRNSGYDNTTTLVYSPYTVNGSDSLTFISNRFENGQNAIFRDNNFNSNLLVLDNNTFNNQHSIALLLNSQNRLKMYNNTLTNNLVNAGNTGLSITSGIGRFEIQGNKFFGYILDAVTVSNSNFSGEYFLFGNNFVSSKSGLYFSNSANIRVINNSIITGNQFNHPIYFINSSAYNCYFLNNICYNQGNNVAALYDGNCTANGNLYYSNGADIVRYSGIYYQSLNALASATGLDQNSHVGIPPFISNTNDLHIAYDNYIYRRGVITYGWILGDIDGEPRYYLNPCIGADEINLPGSDARIASIDSISNPHCSGTHPIVVSLYNGSSNNITSATINWSVNGILQTPYNWIGSISQPIVVQSAINIGTYTFNSNQNYTIKAWSSNLSTSLDLIPENDTCTLLYSTDGLSGAYTIGGTLPDYTSINTAVLDLKSKGICGPVVFNIRPGAYYFSSELTEILGSSNYNTITFQSENADSTSVEIFKYTSNPLLKINGGKFYNFKQITFLTNSIGINIKLYNNSSNINFDGCQILTNFQTNLGAPQIELSGGNIDNVSIINCKMLAQSQLYIYTSIPANLNNKYDSLILRNNEISWSNNNYFTPDAAEFNSLIYAEFSNNKFDFRGQVEIVADSSRYFNNKTSEPTIFWGSYFYIYNNFMSIGASVYGPKVFFIHNSVHGIPSTTDPVLAVYDSSFVQNNIFYASSTNGYLYDPNGNQSDVGDYINSDYNVFYSDGNYFTGNSIGNLTFSQWQAISGADSHSIVANPSFQNIDNLHVNNSAISIPSIPYYSYINDDIDGDTRSQSNPDPGADEFSTSLNTFDGGISSTSSNSNICLGMQNIKVRIYNAENFISMTNAKINWSVNGIIQPFYNWYGLIAPSDTSEEVMIGNYNFIPGNNVLKIWITEPNGFIDSNHLNDTIITISATNTAINIGNDTIICEGESLVLNAGLYESYLWSTNDTSQSITVNDGGVYFVTVTDSNSCVNIDSINISMPIVDFGPDTTICSNATMLLSASSNFISFLWSTGETAPSIVGSPGNTYWLQATSLNSCFSSDTISIGSNPSPQINLGNDTSICANSQIPLSPGAGFYSYLWNNGITNSTYYSWGGHFGIPNEVWVIVTNNYNCQSKDTINIYANEVNATITCTSNGAILDAGFGYQLYNWSGDNTSFYSTNQVVTVTDPDTYTINAMDSNGCQYLSEYNINSFSPSAAFSFIANQLIVNFTCNTIGATYLWDFGDGTTSALQNPSHTYSTAGNYNVTLSVTNDCGNANSSQLVNVSTIGISENELLHYITVYPNPNEGFFNVSFNGMPPGEYQISLLNSVGQKLIEKSIRIDLKNNIYLIAEENLISGVYFIKIDSKELSFYERVVIIK